MYILEVLVLSIRIWWPENLGLSCFNHQPCLIVYTSFLIMKVLFKNLLMFLFHLATFRRFLFTAWKASTNGFRDRRSGKRVRERDRIEPNESHSNARQASRTRAELKLQLQPKSVISDSKSVTAALVNGRSLNKNGFKHC